MQYTINDAPIWWSDEETPKVFVQSYKRPDKFVAAENAKQKNYCFVVQENDPCKDEYLANCETVLLVDCKGVAEKRAIVLDYARKWKIERYFDINDDLKLIRTSEKVRYTVDEGLRIVWEKFKKTDCPLLGLSTPGFCFGKMPEEDVYGNGWLFYLFYINTKTMPEDINWNREGLDDLPIALKLLERGLPVKKLVHWAVCQNWALSDSNIGVNYGVRCKIVWDVYKEFGNIISFTRNSIKGDYPVVRLTKPWKTIYKEGGFKREFSQTVLDCLKACEDANYENSELIEETFEAFHEMGKGFKKVMKPRIDESIDIRNLYDDTLIVIISGKRPVKQFRTTERRVGVRGKWIIISNNSEGYESDLEIVNVPDDFRGYYKNNHALSEFGMGVCLSRSYAIKYARDKGYKYLIQLDDNCTVFDMKYIQENGTQFEKHYTDITPVMNLLTDVLRYTNAGMSGLNMMCMRSERSDLILRERYVYSVMCLDLEKVGYFFGDVEEDIEMRLQLAQKNIPVAQIVPLRYQKLGQYSSQDTTGNRTDYVKEGQNRGRFMERFYGDVYSREVTDSARNVATHNKAKGQEFFKHKLAQFQVGLKTKDNVKLQEAFKLAFSEIMSLPDKRDKYS
jgi:hypothetical protein